MSKKTDYKTAVESCSELSFLEEVDEFYHFKYSASFIVA